MQITSFVLWLVIVLNIFFAILIIFRERRDPSSTWAWLLVLFFIPLVGFVLYLLLGQNLSRYQLFQWEDLKKTGIEKRIRTQLTQISSRQFEFCNRATRKSRELIIMNLINNNAVLTQDNSVELFTDGHEKFARLFKDVEAAMDHIHLEYYMIKKDQLGKKLIDLLTKKAKEGVKVRVLYDDVGSRGLTKRFFKEFREAGGEAEVFFPSKFHFFNLRLNYRNHRKLIIIDGKIGYVGGFNVGNEYLGDDPKFGYWRDTHVRIQGTAVYAIQTRFILDWNQTSHYHKIPYDPDHFPEGISQGNVGIQIVTSGPDSELEHIKNGFIKMILSAKKSVLIQTPYFVPDTSVLDALRIACSTGIEVKIMIPNKPDHIFVYWATMSYIGELLKAGAKVYIYKNGFIHAKTIIIDEEISSVGTANIDIRSFKLDFEVNAFLYDKGIAQKLTKSFKQDVKVSSELTLEEYQQSPKWVRFKESISRLLSPIL
ncbi:MAG TPA: cardiolipin synthase [Bacillus sp. (in: firmicutes)]|uniref:cardiolipin synthase n=1 Tax=Bacillus litorisediminis TaxID=2922713 RepID=UPI001FAD6166|nr:cardiolipin synthase [Bacillus litorisediminis]HWO75958.1 cardiolipin synthase [Bacillus sp. (in: firmicutes)]